MPARTGKQYIEGLRDQPREVWLGGERIKDVSSHPALCGGVQTMAAIYDMQHDPELRDIMTFDSPSSGERVGMSFIIPRSREELERRGKMSLQWARRTCGMM